MRILVVTNLYPNPYQPNRATFNRHQFRVLSEHHAVRVIAPILWTDERKARKQGKPVLRKPRRVTHDGLEVEHPRYWYTPRVLRSWYGQFFQWSVKSAFKRAVAEFRPDLVLGSWAYPDGWATVRLARKVGLPVVLKVHGSDICLVDDVRGRREGTAEAIRQADGVIAVSNDLARRVVQLGADPTRVRMIDNGVDREVFRSGDRDAARTRVGFTPGTRHMLFVGNLVRVKGIDVLIDACCQLPGHLSPWELHIVGEGELRSRLMQQVVQAGISERVRFHGSRPHSALPEWYRAADLVVLSSRSEGIPNVLLESAACGTPFVATDVGGIPEIAHLGASRLVPPNHVEALAKAIGECLEQPPASPAVGPRDRREAVAELANFFAAVLARFRAERTVPPLEPVVPAS